MKTLFIIPWSFHNTLAEGNIHKEKPEKKEEGKLQVYI